MSDWADRRLDAEVRRDIQEHHPDIVIDPRISLTEWWPGSYGDPDTGPDCPPDVRDSMWVWYRLGEHPKGLWIAGNARRPGFGNAVHNNRTENPIFQDKALGRPGDWGNFTCHACGYFSNGYPEPDHHTECDGKCKRFNCPMHAHTASDPKPPISSSEAIVAHGLSIKSKENSLSNGTVYLLGSDEEHGTKPDPDKLMMYVDLSDDGDVVVFTREGLRKLIRSAEEFLEESS